MKLVCLFVYLYSVDNDICFILNEEALYVVTQALMQMTVEGMV